jgi:predicted Zn-dependent protease
MGAGVYSKEFEFEADYMGLYLAARANLDIGNAANLWRKMAVTSPGSINEKSYFASHPSSPERFLTMDKTIEEIKAKKASGTPLVPDNK